MQPIKMIQLFTADLGTPPSATLALLPACEAEPELVETEPPPPQRRPDTCPLHDGTAPRVVDLAAGDEFMMALMSDGRVLCWGINSGACGHEFVSPEGGPPRLAVASDCVAEVFPGTHSMSAVRLWDGTLGLWGLETEFEAGNGPARGGGLGKFEPLSLPEPLVWVSPTTGYMLALAESGTPYYWGRHEPEPWLTPQVYPFGEAVTQVDATYPACLLTRTGDVYCFGRDEGGILGTPVSSAPKWTFEAQKIGLPGPASQMGVGRSTVCALVDEEIWCWGYNSTGILGVPFDDLPSTATPLRIEGLPPAKSIHVANPTGCIVGLDDRVTCWGAGIVLGDYQDDEVAPEPWFPEHQFVDFALARDRACGLLSDGRVFCSGFAEQDRDTGMLNLEASLNAYRATHVCAALGGSGVSREELICDLDIDLQ